jgi:hypothetical protein
VDFVGFFSDSSPWGADNPIVRVKEIVRAIVRIQGIKITGVIFSVGRCGRFGRRFSVPIYRHQRDKYSAAAPSARGSILVDIDPDLPQIGRRSPQPAGHHVRRLRPVAELARLLARRAVQFGEQFTGATLPPLPPSQQIAHSGRWRAAGSTRRTSRCSTRRRAR